MLSIEHNTQPSSGEGDSSGPVLAVQKYHGPCYVHETRSGDRVQVDHWIYPLGIMCSEMFKTLEQLPDVLCPLLSHPLRILFHLFLDANATGS